MKRAYLVAQIVFAGCAFVNLMRGNTGNFDFLILSFLMVILQKLEGESWRS